VGQIAGEYAQLGIGMVMIDAFDAPDEIALWVSSVECFTLGNEVGIRKVNQFHVSDLPLAKPKAWGGS